MASRNTQHVAIIGAGVSGVVSAAHLLERGLRVTVFERNSLAGGVWVYNDKVPPEPAYPAILPSRGEVYSDDVFAEDIPGPCHPGLTNNVGTRLMKTSLQAWPEGTPDITTHDVMKNYIQAIARAFEVNAHVRYKTNVLKVERQHSAWVVTTKSRETGDSLQSQQPTTCDENFDAVIVATGHYHAPRVPDIPGLGDLKRRFPLRISHSKSYRGPQNLKGKNVLLIGTGASAVDIARDAIPLAQRVYHSWRGGQFDVPLGMFPQGVIHIPEVIRIQDKGQDEYKSDDHTLPVDLYLADGNMLCDIDAVILCTGYHISLPFLSNLHDDYMPVDKASEDILVTDGTMYHNLHKDIFYIPDPTLIFVGVPYYTANFSLFDFQAQVVASVLAGYATLPSTSEMRGEYNDKLAQKGAGKQFHSLRGFEVEYVNELLSWINPQLTQHGQPHVRGHTEEWLIAKREQMEKMQQLFNSPSTAPNLHSYRILLSTCS